MSSESKHRIVEREALNYIIQIAYLDLGKDQILSMAITNLLTGEQERKDVVHKYVDKENLEQMLDVAEFFLEKGQGV